MIPRKRLKVEVRECAICVESKPEYRNFPSFSSCTSHGPDTCLTCYARQTVTILESNRPGGWDACTCPQCNTPIPTEELQGILPRALVTEMKELVKRASLTSDDAWRWCLAPGCGHGSLETGKKDMVTCRKCNAKSCFKHQVPWHQGYTCESYETSHPDSTATKSTEEMIKIMSKACPGCGWRVEKNGGCNHMRCGKCRRDWNWNQVAFDGEELTTSAEVLGGPIPEEVLRMELLQQELDDGVLEQIIFWDLPDIPILVRRDERIRREERLRQEELIRQEERRRRFPSPPLTRRSLSPRRPQPMPALQVPRPVVDEPARDAPRAMIRHLNVLRNQMNLQEARQNLAEARLIMEEARLAMETRRRLRRERHRAHRRGQPSIIMPSTNGEVVDLTGDLFVVDLIRD